MNQIVNASSIHQTNPIIIRKARMDIKAYIDKSEIEQGLDLSILEKETFDFFQIQVQWSPPKEKQEIFFYRNESGSSIYYFKAFFVILAGVKTCFTSATADEFIFLNHINGCGEVKGFTYDSREIHVVHKLAVLKDRYFVLRKWERNSDGHYVMLYSSVDDIKPFFIKNEKCASMKGIISNIFLLIIIVMIKIEPFFGNRKLNESSVTISYWADYKFKVRPMFSFYSCFMDQVIEFRSILSRDVRGSQFLRSSSYRTSKGSSLKISSSEERIMRGSSSGPSVLWNV